MLLVNHNNFKYHRILTDNFSEKDNEILKKNYDYSFVISYGSFESISYDVIDKNAVIIDLNKDVDQIILNFKPKVRNKIRKFDKIEQLTFHKLNDNDNSIYEFYKKCENSRGWYPILRDEFFSSIVFYICYKNVPISGICCYNSSNKLRISRIFSLRRILNFENDNLYFGVAAKRLVYEFCIYGIENGFNILDLGGIDLKSDIKSGINEFKLSFTDKIVPVKIGRFVQPPNTYEIINNKFSKDDLDLT